MRRVRVTPAGSPTKSTGHLYKVVRTAKGWSRPVELPPVVNISPRVFKPSLAANGDLYFMADVQADMAQPPKWRLYRSALKDGAYQTAEPLSFSDGTTSDVDPGVAPDQSFLVFSSAGRKPMDDGHEHLFIVFRKDGGWSAPTPLRYADDKGGYDDGEANVAPDGRVYFTSGRQPAFDRKRTRAQMQADYRRMELWDNSNSNVWSLPLGPYLAAAKTMTSTDFGRNQGRGTTRSVVVGATSGATARKRRCPLRRQTNKATRSRRPLHHALRARSPSARSLPLAVEVLRIDLDTAFLSDAQPIQGAVLCGNSGSCWRRAWPWPRAGRAPRTPRPATRWKRPSTSCVWRPTPTGRG